MLPILNIVLVNDTILVGWCLTVHGTISNIRREQEKSPKSLYVTHTCSFNMTVELSKHRLFYDRDSFHCLAHMPNELFDMKNVLTV